MTDKPGYLRSTWLGSDDGVKLDFRVDDITTLMLTWESIQVYSSDSEEGSYTALGSPVALVADTYEYSYTDATGTESNWYKVALYEAAGPTEGSKTDPVVGSGGGLYASVQDVRDEGINVSSATNVRVRRAIERAEAWLHRTLRRWFYPRYQQPVVDGSNARLLLLQQPIIQIDAIEVLGVDWPTTDAVEIELSRVEVYNRHLTQALFDPDDRDSPKLALPYDAVWPKGKKNIRLTGWFGYTELGPSDSIGETEDGSQVPLTMGQTPPDIKDAILMLVMRYLPQKSDPDEVEWWTQRHRVSRYKTRSEEVQLLSPKSAGGTFGQFTGDPELDRILSQFSPPATGKMV